MARPDAVAAYRELWARFLTDAEPERMLAMASILRGGEILLRQLDAACKPHGITYSQLEYLAVLFYTEDGRLPLGKIAQRLYVTGGNITQTTDRLVRAGLIERSTNPTDKRSTIAEITEDGRTSVKDALLDTANAQFGLDAITPQEAETLFTILRKVRLSAGDFSEQE